MNKDASQNMRNWRAKSWFGSVLFVLAATVLASGQNLLYNNNGNAPNSTPSGLATGATSKSGVAAPAGAQWSEVQNNAGTLTESNTSAGSTCTGTFRIADNFTVPAGQTWSITSIDTYAYQSGFTGTTSPFTGATLRVWNGAPNAGGTIVYGDTTTNRLGPTVDSGLFRIFNTVAPPPGTVPGTTRRIWRNTINTTALSLTAGTYWLDYAFSGPATAFCPNVTIVDTRGLPGFNSLQLTAAPSTWTPVVDAGNPATAPDVPQDFPFQIRGTGGGPQTSGARFDFDGDGKADYAVFRPTGATWFIRGSQSGNSTATPFGQSGDVLAPEDYDGDGKFDIAVFRAGAWYLQQSTAGFRAVSFGAAGDIPQPADFDGDGKSELAVYRGGAWYVFNLVNNQFTSFSFGNATDKPVVGDYDGDNKADYAVFRDGAWYVQGSTAGFSSFNFGQAGDKAVTADYDGDNKNDYAVFRSGSWYIQRSTAGFQSVAFGVGTDRPVPADFDGDGRADVAVYRDGNWYVQGSTSGFTSFNFGTATDTPVENVYIP